MTTTFAKTMASCLDPVQFCRAGGFEPDDLFQTQLLRSRHPRILCNVARQLGKSVTLAWKACHTATFEPGSLVLCVAPSLRQSMELGLKIRQIAKSLDNPVPSDSDSAVTWALANGSRVVVLPGVEQTVRSFSAVRLLLLDEASRIDPATVASVRPMLATNTRAQLIMASTPAGAMGPFYEAWEDGGPAYERYMVKAEDCPRISAEFLAQERVALGEWAYMSEYECSFQSTSAASVFTPAELANLIHPEVEQW